MNNASILPTFLKWAGGKRRILNKLEKFLPEKVNTYFEPFLGGGSFFFFIAQTMKPKKAIISDLNADLIETYINVKENPLQLIKFLKKFKTHDSEEFYYSVRKDFNTKKIEGIEKSAAFIYMNKTCFSGIFRVNSKNEFNVPYGKYIKPEIFNEETIFAASKLLSIAEIRHCDYRDILEDVHSGDFVYLDPCYDPKNKTSFVQYTPEKFDILDRIALSNFVNQLDQKNVNVLLSNNNIAPVRKIYSNFFMEKFSAPRSLAYRWAGGRGTVSEIAIHNYPVS